MDAVIQSGGQEPSLEASNAEISSLFKLALELPTLPVAAITEPAGEIQIG